MTNLERAREWLRDKSRSVANASRGIYNDFDIADFDADGTSLAALLDSVERERDRAWCAALIPEGTDVVARVTLRFNTYRALAPKEPPSIGQELHGDDLGRSL